MRQVGKYNIDYPEALIPEDIETLVEMLANDNNREVGKLARKAEDETHFSMGLVKAVKTAIQDYNKSNSQATHNARERSILTIRDSNGKTRARKF